MASLDPATVERRQARWGIVVVAVLAGVAVAAHIGKLPPMLPAIRAELGLGMVFGGWVFSTFPLIGAALAPFVGAFADRLGAWRAMALGLAAIGGGSLLGAAAADGSLLLASRAIEGVGFLAVAVAAPMVLVAATEGRRRRLVMGIWGAYMPAGLTATMLAAPLVAAGSGWRGVWIAAGALALAWVPAVVLAAGKAPLAAHHHRTPVLANLVACWRQPGVWLLAAAFGLYTIPWITLMVWLPTFLVETRQAGAAVASVLTAAVVFCNAPGNLAAGWLLSRGVARWILMAIAALAMGIAACGIFSSQLPDVVRFLLCLAFSGFGGLLPTAVLAGAPVFAPSPGAVGTVNGMLLQGSNAGQVIGPPLAAFVVTASGGWHGALLVIAAACTGGLAVAFAIRRFESRRPPT